MITLLLHIIILELLVLRLRTNCSFLSLLLWRSLFFVLLRCAWLRNRVILIYRLVLYGSDFPIFLMLRKEALLMIESLRLLFN
jgi:hypothetical protein